MKQDTRRQLRGLTDLVTKAVDGTVAGIEPVHQQISHYPYAVLTQIPGIGAPARAIERLQIAITTESYADRAGDQSSRACHDSGLLEVGLKII